MGAPPPGQALPAGAGIPWWWVGTEAAQSLVSGPDRPPGSLHTTVPRLTSSAQLRLPHSFMGGVPRACLSNSWAHQLHLHIRFLGHGTRQSFKSHRGLLPLAGCPHLPRGKAPGLRSPRFLPLGPFSMRVPLPSAAHCRLLLLGEL